MKVQDFVLPAAVIRKIYDSAHPPREQPFNFYRGGDGRLLQKQTYCFIFTQIQTVLLMSFSSISYISTHQGITQAKFFLGREESEIYFGENLPCSPPPLLHGEQMAILLII